jgi:hypothetical protein
MDAQQFDRYEPGTTRSACGWCNDRWGLSWQIAPRTLTEAMAVGGAEAKRAFEGDDVNEEDRRRHHGGGTTRLTPNWAGVRSTLSDPALSVERRRIINCYRVVKE